MKLSEINVGEKFILERTGRKYKKVGQHNRYRSAVKPVNHCVGVGYAFQQSLNDQSLVIKC